MGSFTKNALITFFTRLATAVFTVVITIVIARTLGPRGQGIYSVATLLPSLLLVFTSFGLNPASVFFLGKKKYPPKEILGTSIFSNILVSIITLLIGFLIISFFSEAFFPAIERIYLLLSLLLIPLLLFFNLGCQILLGLQKINKYNFISLLQNGFFLAFIAFLLLGMHFGVTVTVLAQIASFVVVLLISAFIVIKATRGVELRVNRAYLKESFFYGIKVHLAGIFDFLHSRIDLFLINFFMNPVAAGIYYAAVRLVEGVGLFSISTGTVLFPRIASEKNEKKIKEFTPLVCRNVLFITFLILIILFLAADFLIPLFYSSDFLESIKPFQILLLGTLTISGWYILANDLAARGKPMLNTYAIGGSALLNIILNILWIPKYGIVGAAWATTISYTLMFLATVFIYKKVSGNKISKMIFIQKKDFGFYKDFFSNIKISFIRKKDTKI